MRYRVTASRTIEGYELKAAYVYAAGDILDEATAPAGHIPRLEAAGVLEPLADEPAPSAGLEDGPPAERRRGARRA